MVFALIGSFILECFVPCFVKYFFFRLAFYLAPPGYYMGLVLLYLIDTFLPSISMYEEVFTYTFIILTEQ